MARPIRVEYEGAVYHVTARGNERRSVYRDDRDRRRFLLTLQEAVEQHGLRLHSYCLMPNHYHLLVETPRGNLSRAIGWLQTTYTIRFNRRHRRSGHLFQGRFKAHLVDADSYAMTLLRYVHLNPVRPKDRTMLIPAEREQELNDYEWSSHQAYGGLQEAPSWLCLDWLGFFGRTVKEGQGRYRRFVADAFGQALENPWENLKFGLALGGEALVERVKGMLRERTGQEEVGWVSRTEDGTERMETARRMAAQETDLRWQVWIMVRLGGQRRIDTAREYGYQDGSAISQIIRRLEQAATADMTSRQSRLRKHFEIGVSCVES